MASVAAEPAPSSERGNVVDDDDDELLLGAQAQLLGEMIRVVANLVLDERCARNVVEDGFPLIVHRDFKPFDPFRVSINKLEVAEADEVNDLLRDERNAWRRIREREPIARSQARTGERLAQQRERRLLEAEATLEVLRMLASRQVQLEHVSKRVMLPERIAVLRVAGARRAIESEESDGRVVLQRTYLTHLSQIARRCRLEIS